MDNLEKLKAYQAWRRGGEQSIFETTTATEIGFVIDWAIAKCEQLEQVEREREQLKTQVELLNNELRQQKLIHIGFTNEHQVTYVTEEDSEGAFYPDSDNGCYIPVYMLDIHAQRVGYESVIYCENMRMKRELREIRQHTKAGE